MDDKLRKEIEDKIASQGLQKKFVAKRVGLDQVRFSQTLAGKRKLTGLEYTALKSLLGLNAQNL